MWCGMTWPWVHAAQIYPVVKNVVGWQIPYATYLDLFSVLSILHSLQWLNANDYCMIFGSFLSHRLLWCFLHTSPLPGLRFFNCLTESISQCKNPLPSFLFPGLRPALWYEVSFCLFILFLFHLNCHASNKSLAFMTNFILFPASWRSQMAWNPNIF